MTTSGAEEPEDLQVFQKLGGRQKGTPNQATREVREMFRQIRLRPSRKSCD